MQQRPSDTSTAVRILAAGTVLDGDLATPPGCRGAVLFVHGSGSGRRSPRNRYVAESFNRAGLGTLLFDLLTREEEASDRVDASLRFDIGLLTERLVAATRWLDGSLRDEPVHLGYFGASTGAAAALRAAAELPGMVHAVVSRGGRPDLAGNALPLVHAPTLLIVGGDDTVVIELNQRAMQLLSCEKRLVTIPRAGHLFEEPGALEAVAEIAASWLRLYLTGEHHDLP